MKVYTLERCYEYEGCSCEGVFRTKRQAEKAKSEFRYSPDEWKIIAWDLPKPTRKRSRLGKGESR